MIVQVKKSDNLDWELVGQDKSVGLKQMHDRDGSLTGFKMVSFFIFINLDFKKIHTGVQYHKK